MANKAENKEYNNNSLTPKGKHNYAALLKYLSDPDNDWPKRFEYSKKILGYVKDVQIYQTLSPQLITEIENEALENRKIRSARQRGVIRHALFKRAVGYKHPAVHVLSNRVKTTDKKGIITEKTEPLIVDIIKEYPPDPVAAREFLDRVEGKVTEKHEVLNKYEGLDDDEIDNQINALLSNDPTLLEKVMEFLETNGGDK